MVLLSALCIGLGIWPEWLYQHLPYESTYVPYTAPHVVAQLQLLLFSGLAFFVLLTYLKRTLTITLDTDWLWRRGTPALIRWGLAIWAPIASALKQLRAMVTRYLRDGIAGHLGDAGTQAKTWSLAAMGLVVLVMLIVQLLLLIH